jgi:hypothetical protein
MRHLVVITFAMMLFGCVQRKAEVQNINDSIAEADTVPKDVLGGGVVDLAAPSTSDATRDSLFISDSVFSQLTKDFYSNARQVQVKHFGGGDCEGWFKRFVMDTDTFTVDCMYCGEYGFSNAQFINRKDSILMVRIFDVDNLIPDYSVSEMIYTFKGEVLTLSVRSKTINDTYNSEISFGDSSFDVKTIFNSQKEYSEMKKMLK